MALARNTSGSNCRRLAKQEALAQPPRRSGAGSLRARVEPEEAENDEVALHVESPEDFSAPTAEGPLSPASATLEVGTTSVTLEVGEIGQQADAAVWASENDARVLSSCCVGPRIDRSGQGSMTPLQVVYSERFSGAGSTPGGFVKRDGRIKEFEVLVARLIDRSLRPIVAEAFPREVQLSTTVFSIDPDRLPDQLALLASSAALSLSRVPLELPAVAGVRVIVDSPGSQPQINPSNVALDDSDMPLPASEAIGDDKPTGEHGSLSVDRGEKGKFQHPVVDMIVSGTKEGILMVEGGADLSPKEDVLCAINSAHVEIARVCDELEVLAAKAGREKESVFERWNASASIKEAEKFVLNNVGNLLSEWSYGGGSTPFSKQKRGVIKDRIKERALALANENDDGTDSKLPNALIGDAFERQCKKFVRASLSEGLTRQDGRAADELRPISASSGRMLPNAHGSAIFRRGETQAIGAVQLGSDYERQQVDSPTRPGPKRFSLDYYFPPMSVGETGRLAGMPSRREVGHGALAERGLKPIVPPKSDFAHNIRVESTISGSNGSSSMASVCVGTLAMLDAGIPIKQPVGGVAIGLVKNGSDPVNSTMLVDILGSEDFMGDMDLKVAGGGDGTVSAVQLDVKNPAGLNSELFVRALDEADSAIARVIDTMMSTCSPPPQNHLAHGVDRTLTVQISPEMVGKVIGPGGKTVNEITQRTGISSLVFDSESGQGTLRGKTEDSIEAARRMVHAIVGDVHQGDEFTNAKVMAVPEYGIIVELAPETKALIHVSTLNLPKGSPASESGIAPGETLHVIIQEVNSKGYKAALVGDGSSANGAGAKDEESAADGEAAAAAVG